MNARAIESDRVVPLRRLALDAEFPAARKALDALEAIVHKTDLEPSLRELVRLRVSQLNGCAFCVDVHSRDAMGHGETERRIFAVPVWRETPFFSARERAALELAEAMTRLADRGVPDETFERAAEVFTRHELAELIWVITVVNAWNRLGATTRAWPLN
ncbi:MAG TPA: carboxymuconolactone decarboxylase family protein [Jatrophihabitans sp.]|nr:carboxymuconolactone decarboxylase family protein [Jatrophihabitans sp.]